MTKELVERLRAREAVARGVANQFFNGERPLDADPLEDLCRDAADTLTTLMQDKAKLEGEVGRLREAVVSANSALQPFSDRVFNDNGDCTVTDTHRCSAEKFIAAHFAYKKCRAALSATTTNNKEI